MFFYALVVGYRLYNGWILSAEYFVAKTAGVVVLTEGVFLVACERM